MAYRIYVTDSFYLNAQNKGFSQRWYDLINNQIEQDDRTSEEIISDLKSKLKNMGGEN